ncbi:CD109 antigen-like protein [Daphnia magna]|uniref:CD109 antigen-like protein n=1 Tax=Daphnia magna TaxID=35525 RepID=A0A162D702_9CRUS|nr:CD109 antigen-like protein [Daphnia magna]
MANTPTKETTIVRDLVYWSKDPVPSNQIVYENQGPFLQPRLPMQQDAVAVEATSYSLLVYLARNGIGDLQERVVTWLNTMRMVDGGFVSIYDSIVATDDSILTSKVFMREAVEQQIERNRLDQMREAAINIQRAVWTHQLRKDFPIQRPSAVLIQVWVRRYQARKRFNTIRRGVILAQAQFRAPFKDD